MTTHVSPYDFGDGSPPIFDSPGSQVNPHDHPVASHHNPTDLQGGRGKTSTPSLAIVFLGLVGQLLLASITLAMDSDLALAMVTSAAMLLSTTAIAIASQYQWRLNFIVAY